MTEAPEFPSKYIVHGHSAWCSRVILNHLKECVRMEYDNGCYTCISMDRFLEDFKKGKVTAEKEDRI